MADSGTVTSDDTLLLPYRTVLLILRSCLYLIRRCLAVFSKLVTCNHFGVIKIKMELQRKSEGRI
jgi:hypothetical protein